MLKMYGLKNYDTVKKARRFLQQHHVEVQFHDYRLDGVDAALLQRFISTLGYKALLNTRGTSWRKLESVRRDSINDADSALAVMLEQPALIKRPLLCADNGAMLSGFDQQHYMQFIAENS